MEEQGPYCDLLTVSLNEHRATVLVDTHFTHFHLGFHPFYNDPKLMTRGGGWNIDYKLKVVGSALLRHNGLLQ